MAVVKQLVSFTYPVTCAAISAASRPSTADISLMACLSGAPKGTIASTSLIMFTAQTAECHFPPSSKPLASPSATAVFHES